MDRDLKAIVDAASGFRTARVLLSAIELDLFTHVGPGAEAKTIARRLDMPLRGVEMLLNALAATGFLTKQDGSFACTPATDRYLNDASGDSVRGSLLHTVHLWDRWSRLTDCVATGSTVTGETASLNDPGRTEAFIAAMQRSAGDRARKISDLLDCTGVARMLDIGGGSGAYSIALAKDNPALEAVIMDLPQVTPITRRHIEQAGLAERIQTVNGDYHTARYGDNYDLVLASSILHINTPEENLAIIRKAFDCLNPGGRLVISEFLLNQDKAGPEGAALFSINMLVATVGGAAYSEAEYRAWLTLAGFDYIRRIDVEGPVGLIIGVKPAE